MDQLTNRKSKH